MRDVSGPENAKKKSNKEEKQTEVICNNKPAPDRKPQRSVSFNRDVRVKRIVSDSGNPQVVGALAGDGAGYLVTPVRRERLGKLTRKQIAEEAAKVLDQADRVDCLTSKKEPLPDKFYTLPARKKHRSSSQESLNLSPRRYSEELAQNPPKKPPRTFASTPNNYKSQSLLRLFKPESDSLKKKNTDLRRSRSDVSDSKSKTSGVKVRKRTGSESEEICHARGKKAQLSPIIEIDQREDYFSKKNKNDYEIEKSKTLNKNKPVKKWNKSLLEEDFQNKYNKNEKPAPEVFIIDVDKAQNINRKPKKFNAASLKNKIKSSLSFRSKDQKKKKEALSQKVEEISKVTVTTPKVHDIPITLEDCQSNFHDIPVTLEDIGVELPKSPRIQEAIKSLEEQSKIPKAPEMIHSSQLPAEKLPLTRGRKVDSMVKRLNVDKSFIPPKTNLLVTPTNGVQHNNNQPFSYTRGLSPERPNRAKSPSSPVIYAQVVVGNGDPDNPRSKQTIHTVYNGKKQLPHSDSDEGLGYEESNNFGRKYEEKSFTHFGNDKNLTNFYKDDDFPTKFKSFGNYTNGYYNEYKNEFVDSSARGRGDGMDSRRRESVSEFQDSKLNGSPGNFRRSDLSYRRDLLESRINSRKFGDKSYLTKSPDFQESYSPKGDNKYITEKVSSRYYRRGSNSPLGYTEKYKAETKIDKHGEKYVTESKTTTKFSDYDNYSPVPNRYDNEPKSLDSQASDYRSSPENLNTRNFLPRSESPQAFRTIYTNRYKKSEKSFKERDHYKSNPEINYLYDDHNRFVSETFHDSLRRQKSDESPKRNEKYFDSIEERKDKFGDSGIENDFRRDSGERIRVNGVHNFRSRELSNESEDEGFASSLLIASERQNLEQDSRKRRDYDSDREGKVYTSNKEEYRSYEGRKLDYVPRERSIDDGSHFDPRIDKEFDKEKTLKKVDKKPPKPQKKSSLEKVKSLFTRDSSKKKTKDEPLKMVTEGTLRARYSEYKGSQDGLSRSTSRRDKYSENSQTYDYSNRRRLSTPSPSPSRANSTRRSDKETGSWFKSLDSRLTRKKDTTSSARDRLSEDEKPSKNLRFFGDTDIESNDSVRYKATLKPGSGHRPTSSSRNRSQSTRDLHQISEESRFDDTIKRSGAYKSLQNINGSDVPDRSKSPRSSLKPPASPARRPSAESGRGDSRNRRRKNEVSSVGSSTEGDSSQQSQRSVVYLHAATVGDIPDPNFLSRSRRAQSREELTSLGSSRMQPQVKTLSRSFSMLAPWKPRNPSDAYNIDYTNYNSRPVRSKTSGNKTAKERSNQKKLSESRKSSQHLSTLNRRTSKSKENMSTLSRKTDDTPKSSTTLYKKRDSRTSKENSRYSSNRLEDKKISSKSMSQSVESLGNSRANKNNVSRSVSMPRNTEKPSGWFSKINDNKKIVISQRL